MTTVTAPVPRCRVTFGDRSRAGAGIETMVAPVRIVCMRVMRLLQSFLDGEVDEESAEFVAEHLQWCRNCGPEAETMRRVIAAIRRVRPELDPQLHARLVAAVERYRDE